MTRATLVAAALLAGCGGTRAPGDHAAPSPNPASPTRATVGMDAGASGDNNVASPSTCAGGGPGRVCLAAGVAQFGRAAPETRFEERPPRGARLRAFAIDADEVSAVAYSRCSASGRCRQAQCDDGAAPPAQGPARCVAWQDARAYCEGAGGRLPTEAEWERAAAGLLPEHRTYPWGERVPAGADATDAGGPGAGLEDMTPEGVRDMGGSLAEWIDDAGAFYPSTVRPDAGVRDGAASDARPASPTGGEMTESEGADAGPEFTDAGMVIVDDPRGPRDGVWRVVRGGNAGVPTYEWTSTRRRFRQPGDRRAWIGFRCAYPARAER